MSRRFRPFFSAMLRRLAPLVALAAAGPFLFAAPAPVPIQIAIPRTSISRVNESDARISIALFATDVGRRYGHEVRPEIILYDDPSVLPPALQQGRLHLILINPWDFLAQNLDREMDASLITVSDDRPVHTNLLLVRQDRHFNSISDLRGKKVRVLLNSIAPLGLPWLRTVLLDQHLGAPANFFASAETVDRPSAAILHVFFSQSDACVVDDAAYGTMIELNPAIARELTPLAHSSPLPNSLICFSRTGWPSSAFREDIIRGITELPATTSGRQILTLFKFDRIDRCDQASLDSIRDLRRRYLQLAPPLGL